VVEGSARNVIGKQLQQALANCSNRGFVYFSLAAEITQSYIAK